MLTCFTWQRTVGRGNVSSTMFEGFLFFGIILATIVVFWFVPIAHITRAAFVKTTRTCEFKNSDSGDVFASFYDNNISDCKKICAVLGGEFRSYYISKGMDLEAAHCNLEGEQLGF